MGWASRRAQSQANRALGPTPRDPVGWDAIPLSARALYTATQILQGHRVDVAAELNRAATRAAWANTGGNIAPTVDTSALADAARSV